MNARDQDPPTSAQPFWVDDHYVRFREPDICIIEYGEVISAAQLAEISARSQAFFAGREAVFIVNVVHRLRSVDPKLRKGFTRGKTSTPRPVAFASVGASFHIQVVSSLMVKAYNLLFPRTPMMIRFFNDEAGAIAWLESCRQDARRRSGA